MHLKRLAAPRSWKLSRKESKFTARPSPGPHPVDESIPLLIVVRDMLGSAETTRETKIILNERKVMVDGKVRTSPNFPIGLMDIIEIPILKKVWTVLIDKRGKFALVEIPKTKAKEKLCKIVSKTLVRGGHVQLNLHDGRNVLVRIKDPKSPKEDTHKTKDTLIFDIEKSAIAGSIPFGKGSLALVTGGKHRGIIARIDDYKVLRSTQPNIVVLATDKEKFETVGEYVFVVGDSKPLIPEVE